MASAKSSKSSAKTVTKGTPKTTLKPAVKTAAKGKGLGKGIGKGIGALIAEDVEDKNEKVVVKEVIKEVKVPADTKLRISEIEPNREQPRKAFDEDALIELAESIKQYGILQPLLVQKKDGYYEKEDGELLRLRELKKYL